MTFRLLFGLCLCTFWIAATGCGSNSQGSNNAATKGNGVNETNASLRRSVDLVGIWLGHAVIDREALGTHLQSLPDEVERNRIEEMAKSFESVSIAMEFRADSSMEVEVEIIPANSAPIRETTFGTWKVISCDANSITVACTENYEGERYEAQTLRYEIADDRDHMRTTVPVGDELRPFNPRFEFERCIEAQTAEVPAENDTLLR